MYWCNSTSEFHLLYALITGEESGKRGSINYPLRSLFLKYFTWVSFEFLLSQFQCLFYSSMSYKDLLILFNFYLKLYTICCRIWYLIEFNLNSFFRSKFNIYYIFFLIAFFFPSFYSLFFRTPIWPSWKITEY